MDNTATSRKGEHIYWTATYIIFAVIALPFLVAGFVCGVMLYRRRKKTRSRRRGTILSTVISPVPEMNDSAEECSRSLGNDNTSYHLEPPGNTVNFAKENELVSIPNAALLSVPNSLHNVMNERNRSGKSERLHNVMNERNRSGKSGPHISMPLSNTRNKIPACKERVIFPREPKILIVKPLGASDKNEIDQASAQTVPNSEAPNQRLDWNKVFKHLVHAISPKTWRLFFIDLFGCGQHRLRRGRRINSIIDQIEADNKGDTASLLFNLFDEWIKLMGTEAVPTQIEEALRGIGDNDALESFKEFMRDPPLMPEQSEHPPTEQYHLPLFKQNTPKFNQTTSAQLPQMHVLALHNVIHTQTYNSGCEGFSLRQNAREVATKSLSTRQSDQQLAENVSTALVNMSKGDRGESSTRMINGNRGKRLWEDISLPFTSDDEHVPFKCRKYDQNSLLAIKRTRSKRKKSDESDAFRCGKLVQWDKLGNEFIIKLIKKLIPVKSKAVDSEEYHLFIHHTVTAIMKKTGVSENVVLSILLEDFNEIHEYKTKRGHMTCIIDTSDCVLTLGCEEFECLKLYAEHARPRVVKRLTAESDEYVTSKYLFIGYDGQPIVEKQGRNRKNDKGETGFGISENEREHKTRASHCSQNEQSDPSLDSVDSSDSDVREVSGLSHTANTFDGSAVSTSGNGTLMKGFVSTDDDNVLGKATAYNCKDTLEETNSDEAITLCDDTCDPINKIDTNAGLVSDLDKTNQDLDSFSSQTEENDASKSFATDDQDDETEDISSFINDISELLLKDKKS